MNVSKRRMRYGALILVAGTSLGLVGCSGSRNGAPGVASQVFRVFREQVLRERVRPVYLPAPPPRIETPKVETESPTPKVEMAETPAAPEKAEATKPPKTEVAETPATPEKAEATKRPSEEPGGRTWLDWVVNPWGSAYGAGKDLYNLASNALRQARPAPKAPKTEEPKTEEPKTEEPKTETPKPDLKAFVSYTHPNGETALHRDDTQGAAPRREEGTLPM
jgi:hypothetical protein